MVRLQTLLDRLWTSRLLEDWFRWLEHIVLDRTYTHRLDKASPYTSKRPFLQLAPAHSCWSLSQRSVVPGFSSRIFPCPSTTLLVWRYMYGFVFLQPRPSTLWSHAEGYMCSEKSYNRQAVTKPSSWGACPADSFWPDCKCPESGCIVGTVACVLANELWWARRTTRRPSCSTLSWLNGIRR